MGKFLPLKYEGLHLLFLSCGKYGHKSNACVDVKALFMQEKHGIEGVMNHQDIYIA